MVKHHYPPPKDRTPFVIGITILLLIIAALKWEDVVRQLNDGSWILTEERQRKVERTLDRNNNAEQYVLLAAVSGWYKCYLCEEGRYWLNAGEIAKIGITTNPAERYSQAWLERNNVEYIIEVTGNLAEVREAEIRRISGYPLLPENMRRPKEKRLVVPVFHKTIDLR